MRLVTSIFIAFFALGLAISSVSAQTTSPSGILEQVEEMEVITSSDPAMLDVQATEETSTYALPYPGMLPTNPLYFFKNIRDSFIGFIISDPLKKAEFELLQSDKKLSAAQFLLKEKEENVGKAVASVEESTSHMKSAFDKLIQTDVKSTDSQAVFQKMAASLTKHEEVLTDLSTSTRNEMFLEKAKNASKLQEKVESYL